MDIFSVHSFARPSTEMRVEHLKANRYSIDAELGSKQALFDSALERYEQGIIEKSFNPSQSASAGLAEIHGLLDFYASASHGPVSGNVRIPTVLPVTNYCGNLIGNSVPVSGPSL